MVCYVEMSGRGVKERKYSLPPPRIRPPFSTPCEDEDTSRLLPDTSVRIQHLLPPSSSERLHGVCSDWAGDFSPCDEKRGMSLRFEVISLFLEWSCLLATWIYYRNCFALVNWSHGFNGRVSSFPFGRSYPEAMSESISLILFIQHEKLHE